VENRTGDFIAHQMTSLLSPHKCVFATLMRHRIKMLLWALRKDQYGEEMLYRLFVSFWRTSQLT